MTELSDLAQLISRCPDCDLCQTRTQAVPGEGPEDARILLIGEGPGFNEDRTGRPFVGASGKFLGQLLGLAGLRREDVFITNIVKCRPPNNRDPRPDEIEACRKWLDTQIQLINPDVIVTLGRHSMNKFIPGATITRIHGDPREIDGRTVVPMFHPAAALHQERYRSLIQADFEKLPAILADAERRARTAAPPPEPAPVPAPPAEQGRLL